MPARPIVASAPLSEFGDLPNSPEFNDPSLMDRDQSYVPGFSELRKARDLKVAEYAQGLIPASAVPTMKVNLRWARNQNKQGAADNTKPYSHGRKGYKVVTKEHVGQEWLKALPPGATVGADGSIRNGDCILMVADAIDAAKSERAKRMYTDERLNGITNSFAQNAQSMGANPAAQPTVEMGPASPTDSAKPGRR